MVENMKYSKLTKGRVPWYFTPINFGVKTVKWLGIRAKVRYKENGIFVESESPDSLIILDKDPITLYGNNLIPIEIDEFIDAVEEVLSDFNTVLRLVNFQKEVDDVTTVRNQENILDTV